MKWRNLLSPLKVVRALRIELSALSKRTRHHTPDLILHFLGGLGDELLLTCIAHELRDRRPDIRIWQISHAAELLNGNPDYTLVLDKSHWALRHSNVLKKYRLELSYSGQPVAGEYEIPPREHILTILCRKAGIAGRIRVRPWCSLSDAEQQAGRRFEHQIAVHSAGYAGHETWMQNKVWFHDRFQQVVTVLAHRYPSHRIIQVGTEKDPPLQGILDLRGHTTLRQTAAILKQSDCFIGTSGLLSHLARAVECRSVIIYGGREHAWQSGYSCNENLESQVPCAPCWLWHHCDFGHRCMQSITADDVVSAVGRVLSRHGEPLATDEIDLNVPADPHPPTYPTVPGWSGIAHLAPFHGVSNTLHK